LPLSAVTLFEPIREQDYIGYNGGIGSRGMDESVLDGYADPEYLALAQEVCPKVKQPVVVAGDPKAQLEQIEAAGVQGFIHIRTNAIAALTEWQTRLGIGGEKK
jgi:hypothetical protein